MSHASLVKDNVVRGSRHVKLMLRSRLGGSSVIIITNQSFNQSINQSVDLFVQRCNRHWTGHEGRMQPPLTGARKNTVIDVALNVSPIRFEVVD